MSDEDRLVGAGGFEPPEDEWREAQPPEAQPEEEAEWHEATPPEGQPQVQRSRVERSFKRMVDLPEMNLPDWEFIASTVKLLQPYKEADDQDTFTIHGEDSRGSYRVNDLEDFREEYDERGAELLTNIVKVYGRDAHGFYMFTVYYDRKYNRGHAELTGGNEIVVNGIAARMEQLGKEASERREARNNARQAGASVTAPAAVATPRWWNHPWVITVVGGVIVGLILFAILR